MRKSAFVSSLLLVIWLCYAGTGFAKSAAEKTSPSDYLVAVNNCNDYSGGCLAPWSGSIENWKMIWSVGGYYHRSIPVVHDACPDGAWRTEYFDDQNENNRTGDPEYVLRAEGGGLRCSIQSDSYSPPTEPEVYGMEKFGPFPTFVLTSDFLDYWNQDYSMPGEVARARYYRRCLSFDAQACQMLGAMFEDGWGVLFDAQMAAQAYLLACNLGLPRACAEALTRIDPPLLTKSGPPKAGKVPSTELAEIAVG